MITFSAVTLTSLSIAWDPGPPPLNRAAELEIGDRPGQRGKPEREGTIGQDGDDRQLDAHAERGEGADHSPVHPTDPTGERERVAEHADEIPHGDHSVGRGLSEGVKAGPEHGDV